ncbi:MAG: hypothetical protein V9E98_10195 [Candidatus Nanopelagicales bacterium]
MPAVDDTDPTTSGFTLDLAGGPSDVVFLAAGMALFAAILWLVYRTMQHPRLPVIRSDTAAPRANWAGVLRYVVTIPIMMCFWLLALFLLLSAAAIERTAEEVVVASVAIVGGARLLAHTNEAIAHELAKTVPIAILGFLLIGGGFAGVEQFEQILSTAPGDLMDSYLVALICFDVLLTAIWFVVLRLRWFRLQRRAAEDKPRLGPWGRLFARLRRIGYGPGPHGGEESADAGMRGSPHGET